mmetsp:Transcript_17312/g.40229  ORF Transcript_17312/g.40229 Transcript_17312/m.40229 type:complete len:120 (+) Transcript_17312:787-1146(+)
MWAWITLATVGKGAPNYTDFMEDKDEFFIYVKKAFKEELRQLNDGAGDGQQLKGYCRIELSIKPPAELTGNDWRYLGYKNSLRMIYDDIKEAGDWEQKTNKEVVKDLNFSLKESTEFDD